MDANIKKGLSDSYRETTWSIIKCNKRKWNFLIPGNDNIVQQIRPINKSGLQEIFTL